MNTNFKRYMYKEYTFYITNIFYQVEYECE